MSDLQEWCGTFVITSIICATIFGCIFCMSGCVKHIYTEDNAKDIQAMTSGYHQTVKENKILWVNGKEELK